MAALKERALLRLSQFPFLISYFLLVIPLALIGNAPRLWKNCWGGGNYYNCRSWNVQDWHVNLVAIISAALVQPTGSFLLAPASPRPHFLSRLNPLICMAEGVSGVFTLLTLHFCPCALSYPAAATLSLYRRESSSLTETQLQHLTDSSHSTKPDYSNTRQSFGFSPLQPRNLQASASLYVFGLLMLIRLTLNKWLYYDSPVMTMLWFHFVVSFGFLHLIILIATSRALTPDEQDVVEEQFRIYLLAHNLQHSLSPDDSTKYPRRRDLDDSWRQVTVFVISYIFISLNAYILLNLVFAGLPKSRHQVNFEDLSGIWELFLSSPAILVACFALMKAGGLKGNAGVRAYSGVAVLSVAIYIIFW